MLVAAAVSSACFARPSARGPWMEGDRFDHGYRGSPAAVFALERANNDLVIFALAACRVASLPPPAFSAGPARSRAARGPAEILSYGAYGPGHAGAAEGIRSGGGSHGVGVVSERSKLFS